MVQNKEMVSKIKGSDKGKTLTFEVFAVIITKLYAQGDLKEITAHPDEKIDDNIDR